MRFWKFTFIRQKVISKFGDYLYQPQWYSWVSFTNGTLRSSSCPVSLIYAAAVGQEGTELRSNGASQEVDYYVFNIGARQGFVIVAGNDRAHPMLGYTEKGAFDPDNLPANLRGMLVHYQKEITVPGGQYVVVVEDKAYKVAL